MSVATVPVVDDFRAEIRTFLAENLPAGWKGVGALPPGEYEAFRADWRERLAAAGYLAPHWPKEYGGSGLSEVESAILSEELALAKTPAGGPNDRFGVNLLGATLLAWGTAKQKEHFLPRVITGEHRWCQGYSEPNAGSDLAGLACRATLDGDEWVINGQKIWTSQALHANWIFLLVRTEQLSAKHQGISFLLCPLDQPGVEIRPIRMMGGGTEFCEVFLTDARTPRSNLVGKTGEGWRVAMSLLAEERGATAMYLPVMFRAELDRLLDLARSTGASGDPIIRQSLAAAHTRVEILRYLGLRTVQALKRGEALGPSASVFKVFWSEHHRKVTELALTVLGAETLVPSGRPPSTAIFTDDPGAPNSSASWTDVFMNARAGTIYAGTSELQRNILGEMVLGLPKEPNATP